MKSAWKFLAVSVCMLLWLSGCARTNPPLFDVDNEGNVTMVKRYAKTMQTGWLSRWSKTAYEENIDSAKARPGTEKEATLSIYGQPHFIRKPFRSLRGDKVDEWLYWDKATLFQYVNDTIVFVGEITDLERTLVQYGYPYDFNRYRNFSGATTMLLGYFSNGGQKKTYVHLKDDRQVDKFLLE